MIPHEYIEELTRRTDIVELVGSYVQLNSVAGTISSGSKSYSGDVIEYTDPDTSEASNADP